MNNFPVELYINRLTVAVHPVGDYAGFPGCGLLRLHSTYRHDLKIYASDEGRVQMTAAAFAKVQFANSCSHVECLASPLFIYLGVLAMVL